MLKNKQIFKFQKKRHSIKSDVFTHAKQHIINNYISTD